VVLWAEWSTAPGPANDAALNLVNTTKGKPLVRLSQSHILRLAQIAAATGRFEQATKLADAITDEGLRAWARGDAVRQRIAANPKEKADEAWAEVPDASSKLKAGHAWGRFWVARQNAKLSGNREDAKKATAGWTPAAIHA